MPTILFEGNSLGPAMQLEEPDGGSLMDICDDADAPVPFSCRGASCGTCRVEVLEGAEFLKPMIPDEKDLLETLGNPPNSRLACCTHVRRGTGQVRLRAADETML